MAQPYVGEIRMAGFNFAPSGWFFCDGSLLPISEYEVLFTLIGTSYGGDGQVTFALPDLRGRIPIHRGNGFVLGQTGGVEEVILHQNHLPQHTHLPLAAKRGTRSTTASANLLASGEADIYSRDGASLVALAAGSIDSRGGNQPHENMQPSLCVNFIISAFGIYPSQF